MRGSTKEWFTAQKDYMESSRDTQAGTAAKWVHGMGPYCVDCAVELREGAG